ncbi:hypothetical protein BDV96DRAFT_639727 [Lophiotrema nucula]|uniref:Ubiquitin-related modifier 1 n=1 Tax=Lophiotrema nucula TaxID=690887 RepID=A0A6A5ZVW1_9PLEO|nr:hypothetical protein BDV96DRAFT_639727 [Lophiotrema nucula]
MEGDQTINITLGFLGGLDKLVLGDLDENQMAIRLSSRTETGKNVNLKYLFKHIYDNLLVKSERLVPKRDPRYDENDPGKQLPFEEAASVLIENGKIRGGNLVVINEADWECIADDLAEELGVEVVADEMEISDGDKIEFVTTLHGG